MAGKVFAIVLAGVFCAGTALAQAPVSLTIDTATASRGPSIPIGFSGLGFERGTETSGNAGVSGYFFSPANTQVVTLFQNLGIKSLRVGGGSVDDEPPAGTESDGYTGVDDVFSFAQAAGIKVLYSLRLLNAVSDAIPNLQADDVAIAQHIVQSDPPFLSSFEIGNEPDFHSYHTYCTASGCTCAYPTGCTGTSSNLHIEDPLIYETVPIGSTTTAGTAFPSYLADWQSYENAIAAGLPSGAAKFSAPDTGAYSTLTDYNGVSWTQLMADDEKSSGILADATQHFYVGGSPGATTVTQAIDNMLSPEWVTGTQIATGPEGPSTYTPYPWLYTNNLAPVVADDVQYRLTESDDYVTGVDGASNSFASALWALDYMHWWASHNAAGVNFHNKQWIYTDTIVPDPNPCVGTCGDYQTAPKGYGIKAFDLGGHGYVEPVTVSNPGGINLTAYAVGAGQDLYVTIINKTHSSTNDATTADVTIAPQGLNAASASSMTLTDGSAGDPTLSTATFGGATIANNARWLGDWTPLGPDTSGQVVVSVPAAQAVVLKLHAASAYAGPIEINQNGALEMFAIDPSGNVWHDVQQSADIPQSSPNNWSGSTDDLTGVTSKGHAAVISNLDNTLEVFVPSSTGDVYQNSQQTPGGDWNGWTDMGSSSNGVTDLYAANNADGSVSVFGVGSNGDVWYSSESAPGIGWSGWTDLTGAQILPGFVVGQDLDGLLEIFGVDSHSQVWHNSQTNASTWSGWTPLATAGSNSSGSGNFGSGWGGNSPAGGFNPNLAVARNLDGRLELFALGPGSRLWHTSQQTPGGTWNAWSQLGNQNIQPGFAAGQDSTGRLSVFGVNNSQGPLSIILSLLQNLTGSAAGENGPVWSISQQSPGGTYGAWMPLGGNVNPRLLVSNTADGRIQLFSTGDEQEVWSDWQTTPSDDRSEWSGWTSFSGKGLQFYPGHKPPNLSH